MWHEKFPYYEKIPNIGLIKIVTVVNQLVTNTFTEGPNNDKLYPYHKIRERQNNQVF